MTLQVHNIRGFRDPLLRKVLDCYQESFGDPEQMPLSWWLDTLAAIEDGKAPGQRLQAFLDDGEFVGCALYECEPEEPSDGYLWYLATPAGTRGKGYGSRIYQQVVAALFDAGCRVLVFEVDRPNVEAAVSREAAETAARRIRWYQRMGARLLDGIDYVQDVGWWPQKAMGVMVHSREPITPEEAFEAASRVLGKNLKRPGGLRLLSGGTEGSNGG